MTYLPVNFRNFLFKSRSTLFFSLSIFILCALHWGCGTQDKDRQALQQKVEQINKKCPTLIDSETQLDGIELKGEHAITYKYTLVHASVLAIDTHQFYLAMWPGILSTIRISPEMQKLRDNEMTVYYKYRDAYNKEIYTFKITPRDYGILK